MIRWRNSCILFAAMSFAAVSIGSPAPAAAPPSEFGVDTPELAHLGALGVGVRTIQLVDRDQPDVLAPVPAPGAVVHKDRPLTVDVWYPARTPPGAKRTQYAASLPGEPPAGAFDFTFPGIAVRDAPAAAAGYPLVIVSHGRSNATYAMSWLTENLASKGYVVAAIRHEDPDYSDAAGFAQILYRRPLDVAFVTRSLQRMLAAQGLIDPAKTALIGYSMGGYGVLTAAGATLDPAGSLMNKIPGGLMAPYARDGALSATLKVEHLLAVVALAPYGGGAPAVWGADGLHGITAPLLLIAGDHDKTINYVSGARALFDAAIHAHRYLLTFHGAGHAIGLNPAPPEKPRSLWDLEWFEDPVWKKQRITAINAHFITAFLDRYVKGEAGKSVYLDVTTSESAGGVWPSPNSLAYDAYSPGDGGISVWKGFQRNRDAGLELLRAEAVRPSP